MKLAHFRDSLRGRLVLDSDAVRGDHGSRAISAAPAMNEDLRVRVGAH
jgi:hypothetical protein